MFEMFGTNLSIVDWKEESFEAKVSEQEFLDLRNNYDYKNGLWMFDTKRCSRVQRRKLNYRWRGFQIRLFRNPNCFLIYFFHSSPNDRWSILNIHPGVCDDCSSIVGRVMSNGSSSSIPSHWLSSSSETVGSHDNTSTFELFIISRGVLLRRRTSVKRAEFGLHSTCISKGWGRWWLWSVL